MWKCGYKYLRCEKLLKICQIVPTLQIREHLVNILFCSAVSCSFMNASIHFLWTPNYAMTEYRVILLTANFSICHKTIRRTMIASISQYVKCLARPEPEGDIVVTKLYRNHAISVAAVDRLEEVMDGQLTGIDSGGHGRRLEIAVTSPYGHDHGQAV